MTSRAKCLTDCFLDPGLWYIGGTVGHARYFSRYIALQIKAQLMGTPLPIYEDGRRSTSLGEGALLKQSNGSV